MMVLAGPDLARLPEHTRDPMNDLLECRSAPQAIAITQCRELLGDEARVLSDEDIDRIRKHARAMAHELIDAFLQRGSSQRRGR